jgi:Putative auto-transporter adhesin, head GIN domain
MNVPPCPTGRLRRVLIRLVVLVLAPFVLGASQPALALDPGWLMPAVVGSGPVVSEAREMASFNALRVNTSARVIVRQGDRHAVEVRGEADVVPLIETRLEMGSLVVEDARRFRSSTAEVVVTVRRLGAIAAAGSTAVVVEGIEASALSLALGGSSTVSLRRTALDSLQAALGGSSALEASGRVGTLKLALGGSSSVQAEQLQAKSVTINGGGSSKARVWVSDALTVALGGSADVGYYGAARPTQATSGSSSVSYLGPSPRAKP